jgi:hypothetical protein
MEMFVRQKEMEKISLIFVLIKWGQMTCPGITQVLYVAVFPFTESARPYT